MSSVARYGLTGILVILALSSYLKFLAERDQKMFDYYSSQRVCESFTFHPDCRK
jgi:O-phosphoseryl-tRNA(Cys) synthetase